MLVEGQRGPDGLPGPKGDPVSLNLFLSADIHHSLPSYNYLICIAIMADSQFVG